jgi:hypothetical protein
MRVVSSSHPNQGPLTVPPHRLFFPSHSLWYFAGPVALWRFWTTDNGEYGLHRNNRRPTINKRFGGIDDCDDFILLSEYMTTSGPLVWWPTFTEVNSSSSCSKEPTSRR